MIDIDNSADIDTDNRSYHIKKTKRGGKNNRKNSRRRKRDNQQGNM